MQNETRMICERLRCWGPSRLTHYRDLRSSQWRKPQKLHRPLFEWTKGLLWSPFRYAKWKATSVTAGEFYGAVIPRNFHEFGCRFCLLRRFCIIFSRDKVCWRYVWRFVCFGQIRLKKWGEKRSCFFLHFFRALSSSCALYNKIEYSRGFSTS